MFVKKNFHRKLLEAIKTGVWRFAEFVEGGVENG